MQQELLSDVELADAVIAGDERAKSEFLNRFQAVIEMSLAKRAKDPATKPAINEITNEVLGDCVSTRGEGSAEAHSNSVSLLQKYRQPSKISSGKEPPPLAAWLRRVAINRFHDWLVDHELLGQSQDGSFVSSDDDNGDDIDAVTEEFDPVAASRNDDLVDLVRESLSKGFEEAARQNPVGLVCLRLVWLHSIQRNWLGVAFNRHQANLTTRMNDAMNSIRRGTLAHLRSVDPLVSLTWDDLRAICALQPGLIQGM